MAGHEDVLSRGIRLFEEGDYEGAEACLNQVTGELGNRALALTVLGRLYLKTDRPEEAEASVRQAMAIRRTTEAYLVLGESLMRQGKWQPAETAFLEAGKRDPQNPDPLIMQGHVLAAQDRLSEAAHCYEQALLRDAQSTTARYYLAETLVRQGDLPRASTQLHYLLQREPTYVPAILLMGDMAFFREDYRQAIVEYVRALELDSLDAPVYERLGQAFSAIGEYAQALKAFETSIKEHPTYWPCYLEAARLCETGKSLRKARRYYQAIAYDPKYRPEAIEAIARIDAHFSQFSLSEAADDATPLDEPDSFKPPETLTTPTSKQTSPLDPGFILQEYEPPRPRTPTRPLNAPQAQAPSSQVSGPLNDWVRARTGKFAQSVKEALPTDAVADAVAEAKKKLLDASNELLPQGLKGLKGLFKRGDR